MSEGRHCYEPSSCVYLPLVRGLLSHNKKNKINIQNGQNIRQTTYVRHICSAPPYTRRLSHTRLLRRLFVCLDRASRQSRARLARAPKKQCRLRTSRSLRTRVIVSQVRVLRHSPLCAAVRLCCLCHGVSPSVSRAKPKKCAGQPLKTVSPSRATPHLCIHTARCAGVSAVPSTREIHG